MSSNGGPTREHSRGQSAVTLIEVLLAVALAALIVVPVSAWSVSTIRQQRDAHSTLSNASALGGLTDVFTRDVASARSVAPAGGDCVGGEGRSGVIRLAIVAGGLDQTRIVYSEARPAGASTGSPERSLWRRVCAPDGTIATEHEVFSAIQPGTVSLQCPTAAVPAPTTAVACETPANRRVRLSLTPAGPASSPPMVVVASRRANSDSFGVPGSGNRPPIAHIGVDTLVGYANSPFSFSAAGSEDLDGSITSYEWEFPSASGTVERSGQTVEHSFAEVGEQTVLLRVSDAGGATNVAAVTVRVVNRYPIGAVAIGPERGIPGVDEFTFDATGSFDPDDPGEPLEYEWDLGPGLGPDRYKTGKIVRFVFPEDVERGQRQITLTVSDSLGGSDTLIRAVGLMDEVPLSNGIVMSPQPVLTVGKSPRVGSVGASLPPLPVAFSAAGGTALPDGAQWRLQRLGSGALVATSEQHSFTHTFGPADAGEYQVLLLDAGGDAISDPVGFRVNAAPTASFTVSPTSGDAPRAVDFESTSSTDSDGSIVAWRWNFGFFDFWTSTASRPTNIFTDPGGYSVRLQVVDDDGAVGEVTTPLTVTGPIPTPAPPAWSASSLSIAPVPAAEAYRVTATCNGAAVDLAGGLVDAAATPQFVLPAGFCPAPAVAAANVQVRKLAVWSNSSNSAVRP